MMRISISRVFVLLAFGSRHPTPTFSTRMFLISKGLKIKYVRCSRTALALWLLMNLLLVVVPRYGAYAMAMLGVTLCAAAGGYWASLPHAPLTVRLDGAMLFFSLGWCFWLVLTAGTYYYTEVHVAH